MGSDAAPLSMPGSDSTENPALSPATAAALLVLYTLIYVIPLYGSPNTRPSPTLNRDSPAVILARIKSVRSSTTACLLSTYFILRTYDDALDASPLHAMGLWPLGLWEAAASLLLTALLFAAPLYETLLIDGLWEDWATLKPLTEVWGSLLSWRNIVVGPVTEELLFRSGSVPLLLLARLPLSQTIFLSPVIFGLAHFHHFYEFRITHPHVPLFGAVARSVLQFSFTTLFGAYATFIFLRTGSLLAAVVVHAFCNAMGLPRLWGAVQPYWLSVYDPKTPGSGAAPGWTVLYYCLLFAGAWAWWVNLGPLTASDAALVDMNFS